MSFGTSNGSRLARNRLDRPQSRSSSQDFGRLITDFRRFPQSPLDSAGKPGARCRRAIRPTSWPIAVVNLRTSARTSLREQLSVVTDDRVLKTVDQPLPVAIIADNLWTLTRKIVATIITLGLAERTAVMQSRLFHLIGNDRESMEGQAVSTIVET
jgi:hypothetical protein